MAPSWILNTLLAIFTVLCGTALYFLQQKQSHYALWTGFSAIVLLLLFITLHVRNSIVLNEVKEDLKPNIKVAIFPDDDPAVNPFRYPLQEYHLHITNLKEDSAPITALSVKFFFPYTISQADGHAHIYSGENAWVYGMYKYERDKNGVSATRDIPPKSSLSKSMTLSIQRWQEDNNVVNSNIVAFHSDKWTEKAAFVGSIVVDLSKKPTIIKAPDEIGKYTGEFSYEIQGKKMPSIKLSGVIQEPNVDNKTAEHHFDLGIKLTKEDKCSQAIGEFDKTIKLNPKHTHAYFNKGYCYGNLGEFEKSISNLDILIEMSPKYRKAYFYRAIAKKNMGSSIDDFEKDFKTACDLGFEKGCKEYWLSKFSNINPADGFFVYNFNNEDWLEPNGELVEIIPHVSKDDFEVHLFRDKDNMFKAMISNAFSKNVILKFDDLAWIKNNTNHPKHEIKLAWYNGEIKLYIDETIVDVHPKDAKHSMVKMESGGYSAGRSGGDIFRALYNIGPEKGRIGFSVSKVDWLKNNGEFITIFPHIYISEQNFEVHGYKDKDFVFRFLFSTSYSKDVILEFSDLESLKQQPQHPQHFIQVAWIKERKELYIDDAGPVDVYPKNGKP